MNGSIGAAIGSGGGSVKFASTTSSHTAAYSHTAHNHAFQSNEDLMPAGYHSLGHNHGPSASAAAAAGQANTEQQQQPAHHHHIHHEHYPNPAHFGLPATAASGSFSTSSAVVTPGTASEPAPYYVRQPPLPPPVPSLPPQYHPYHNHLPLERVESQKSLFQGNVVNGGHSHQLPPTASAEPTLKNPKKSSLKKRSKFDAITRSTQSLTNLVATSGPAASQSAAQQTGTKSSMGLMPSLTRKQSSGSAKHVEIVHFAIKGGPPWGFRIKQRNDNVFISKVNCGGRGHKGGLRVHDEIIAVNNFELDNHPLTLHRDPSSKENVDFDHLTKLDFTYQLIKHTLNRQLFLSVRRWNSDWELAPHIFYPLSTPGDDGEGPHHQSEEELLSPNEDFGPEARSAHRKLLIGYQQHPQSPESQFFFFNGGPLQTPSSVEHIPEHFHHHLDESSAEAQQFLIPPPSNLGFSGSSTDGDNEATVQLPDGESSWKRDQGGESPLYSTSSTTTTGCLIAAAEAEINQAAQEVITPSPSISNSTTVTTSSPTPTSNASEPSTEQYSSEQYSYPTISMATATLTSAVLGGATPIPGPFLLPGDEYYLQQMYPAGSVQQTTAPESFSTGALHSASTSLNTTEAASSEYRRKDGNAQRSNRKGGHRHRRKGTINLLESASDQASDIAPLDLSPDGGSTEDVSAGTPSTRSALSSDSEISRSDLSDSDEETDRSTIRRRIVVDKNNNNNGSDEKMQLAAQSGPNSLDRNGGPNFKLKTSKNIWSPSSSSLVSPSSPPNAAQLNSTENSDLYSDQISVLNTQVPTHSSGQEGGAGGHQLSLHFVSSPSNDHQFGHQHQPHLHLQHYQQEYSSQLAPQFAQAPLSLADYQARHQHHQLNHSSEVVPPPYSSATYEQFEQKQQQAEQQQRHLQQYLAQHPTEPPALFSSSTLPRSMTIMEGSTDSPLHTVPHVAEVYQPRQHPTHKYWTLPRSIATGIPLPNGGPYIDRSSGGGGGGGGVTTGIVPPEQSDVSTSQAIDDVDHFNKHHEQLQQTRIKEIAEQHMKPIHSTTTTTTSGTTVQEEIAHGTQTVSTSTTSKHIIQHVVARDVPPHGATLLYETEDATFYTVPVPEEEDELDQGMQATSSTTVKTTTYAVPKKKLDDGIGPVNESGVPITPKAGVKSEHGSEWYKAWVRNMHKMERAGRDDSANSICVKVKSPRYKGTDYQLTVEGKRGPPKYVPGNIADYEPGHSSISEREKQIFYEEVFNYIDSIFAKVLAPTTNSANQYRSTLCKRAQSLSRMGSTGSPASAYAQPGSIVAERSSGDYGTIQRPSRSMPSLLPDAFLLNQFFNYPPPPKHSPVPPPFDATLGRARRLSMPGKLGSASAASSLSGGKKVKKGAKKIKKKLKKKKTPAPSKPTSSEPTSSDQPDGGQGGGSSGGGAPGSADGNLSDDEREDEDDDEKDQNNGEEEDSEEDEEVADSEDENGKMRDDVSHEADVEDFFEDNSINTEKNGPKLSGQPGTSSQLVVGKALPTTTYYHEKCVFNTLTGQKQAPASVGSGSGYDSDSSYIIKKSKPKQSTTKPASPAVYRAVQRGEIDIPLSGLQRPAPPKQQPRKEIEDYDELESGENLINETDEWNQLDEWQSQIETDFDYIYSTLKNVKAPGPSASTPYPMPMQRSSSLNVSSSVSENILSKTSTLLKSKAKKSVAFDDTDEVQLIEEIEVEDEIDNGFDISNKNIFEEEEVEEEEYSYGGLLRPGSHRPAGYAKSFEHYLNTQDLNKNAQRLKTISGDDRVRVRKHRKRRSRSPGGKSPLRNTPLPHSPDRDSDSYDRLPPPYYSNRSSSNKTGSGADSVLRTSSAAVYQPSQLNEGKINVQYRMPTNKLVAIDPMLDITGSFTSTATGKNSGRYSYSGLMSPASMTSTTVADSSFSTVVKQPTPTPRNIVFTTSSLAKGSEPYSLARHHYMPTAMSPVALDRYERAFADKENEPKKMARVIYDFHAQSRNELAVKKGDLVIVRKAVSLNWVEVEDSASGLVGLVPRSYLDFEQYGVARARYDFAAKTNVEISFKRGEKLTLLRRVDNNWYEGMNEKQDVGIFPVTYVEAIKQPIVLKSLEQQSACSPDANDAPHIHFSSHLSSTAPPETLREPGGGATSQASSTSSVSLASIISIDNKFGKVDPYEHHHHHQQQQQQQQSLHPHPLHSTMMMTPSSMSPSPSGSMSISLASLAQQYQSSSLSSVSSRPLPTPLCRPPLSPVTPSLLSSKSVPPYYTQQQQQQPTQKQQEELQKQAIYFSSTSSEPGAYHHIRRAPEAIRHFGGCGERTCLPKAQIYRVIHPYKPQQMDEIELTYGDLLTVTTLCDDGWYLGRSTLSGKFGTFPGNYVEQV